MARKKPVSDSPYYDEEEIPSFFDSTGLRARTEQRIFRLLMDRLRDRAIDPGDIARDLARQIVGAIWPSFEEELAIARQATFDMLKDSEAG